MPTHPLAAAFFFERYNENHDPDNGQFADGGGSSSGGGGGGDSAASSGAKGGPLPQTSYSETATALKALGDQSLGENELTDAESAALEKYNGDSFETINRGLRKESRVSEQVRQIDSAIDKSHLAEPVTVYRGVGKTLSRKIAETWKASKSASFVDKAFVSTSASKKSALKFSQDMIELKIPAGIGALAFADKGEAELLLGRGHQFKVTAFQKTAAGHRRIKAELVA